MRNPLIYLAIAALLAGCRGGSGSLQRKEQENYDVVQEGQSSSVTSTINAPGEPVPPPVSMTGTNADTTSNFNLPGVAAGTATTGQPGTIAGTLPQETSGSVIIGVPRPRTTTPPPTPPRSDTAPPPPPPVTSTIPPDTDTAPPPPTDTTATPPTQTDTQPPPTTTATGV